MALSVSLVGDWLSSIGSKRMTEGTLTFDSSYLTGGEVLAAADVGLGELDSLVLEQGEDGYIFEWLRTTALTGLVKVRGDAGEAAVPAMVVEEVVTVTSHVGTLAYLPAYIVAVDVTAGAATPAAHVCPVGKVAPAGSVAVDYTTGIMTFNTADAVTSVRVTYFPQKSGTIFDPDNLVIDESLTAAAASVQLANRAFAVQYVWNDTNTAQMVLEPVAEAPTATGNAVVDIVDGSSDTDIDTHSDDDGDTLLVTYLKFSALPGTGLQINDTDITLNSEVWNFGTDGGISGALVVPALGTHLVGEETAANQDVPLRGPSGTAGENIATWSPYRNEVVTAQTGTMTTTATPWFMIPNTPIDAVASSAEVDSTTDLSAVVVRFTAIGR